MNLERQGHVLQTTALVNEAYIRLVDSGQQHWRNRAHFFAASAQIMRSDPVKGETNWKRVEELYHEALSKPRGERIQFLESACPDDKELRREVESLLASLEKDGALLEVPAVEVAARMLAKSPTSTMLEPPDQSRNPDLSSRGGISNVSKAGAARALVRKIIHLAPWWMHLLAAVFLFDCLLRSYCYFLGPNGFDFGLQRQGERPVVVAVPAGSAAERSGLMPGDILLALDGQPIRQSSDGSTPFSCWEQRPMAPVGSGGLLYSLE
jgi:hypothetical protein